MLPYSPLHHLLMADVGEPLVMTSGNVSDEPIAYEDDDACERLADIADLFLLHDRPDRDAHRRLGGAGRRSERPHAAAPLARIRARLAAAPGGLRPAPARLRRRAEEHVRAREGRARVGGPPRRRPEELRDADARSPPGSTTSSACSRSSPRWWRTTCTRSTCPRSTRWSSTACGRWACSITTRTSRRASPSTASAGPAVGAIFDGSGYGERRHRLGRRAAARRPRRASSAWACCSRCGSRAATPRCASRGGWRAPGSPRRSGERPALPRGLRGQVAAHRLAPGGRAGARPGSRRRSRRARAGCSTRWRRCAASARR